VVRGLGPFADGGRVHDAVHWLRLQSIAVLQDRYDRGEHELAGELRLQLAGFGGTPYDVRRLGKTIKANAPAIARPRRRSSRASPDCTRPDGCAALPELRRPRFNDDGRCRECDGFPTLGYQVADLIQQTCVIPDGDYQGQPYILTDEMLRFVIRYYRIDPKSGRFHFRRGAQLRRPQKWGKGPFVSAIVIAECHPEGAVRPDGWDANGDPVGRAWPTPHWQITAVSEGQTDNIWRALQPMIELGALAADIPDTGKTRINLPGGGLIEPVTSRQESRLGQRITGAAQDQTESYTVANGGRAVADTQRRNLAGMGGRFIESPNAWDPSENSVAQETFEDDEPGVYFDYVEPGVTTLPRDKRERRRALKRVYGDSWWVDLDRVDDEIEALIKRDPAQAARWFLNLNESGEGRAFEIEVFKCARGDGRGARRRPDHDRRRRRALRRRARDRRGQRQARAPLAPRDLRGAGAAAARLRARRRARRRRDDRRLRALRSLARLRRPAQDRAPAAALAGPLGRQARDPVAHEPPLAVRLGGPQLHRGDRRRRLLARRRLALERHHRNAYKQKLAVKDDKGVHLHTLAKDRDDSPNKMDAAPASVLAWEARGDAIAAGANKPRKKRSRVPVSH
jgi:hypothetical protein